jgi:hypothetical protein
MNAIQGLFKVVASFALTLVAASAFAAGAGVITHLSGTMSVQRPDGSVRILSQKSEVQPGDVLTTQRDSYAQINFTAGTASAVPVAPPPSLDWDHWCGPGPLIPYSPQVGHKNWRQEKTTGQGHLYDWGLHLIDAARMILGETSPTAVSAAGGLFQLGGKITTPDTLTAQFEYARCPITWRHRMWGAEEHSPETNNGIFFYGEKGTVFVSDAKWSFTPRGKNAERKTTEMKADLGLLHMVDFLDAVRTRKPASCSVEEGHLSTTAVKLAMIARAYNDDSLHRFKLTTFVHDLRGGIFDGRNDDNLD